MLHDKAPFLVTGAAGFVGSHLVKDLLALGLPVRALVRNSSQGDTLSRLGADIVVGDIRDAKKMLAVTEGVQGVFHIAALFRQAGVPGKEYFDVNLEGTRNLLDAAVACGAPRFIHCSTVGVHSHITTPPADENAPYNPADLYQTSKMQGELLALEYFRSGKLPGVVLRPAMIYGPGDMRTFKLFKMIANKRFFYVGKGHATVHFIDVRDLVRAFRLAMEHARINNQVYIIAGRQALPLNEFTTMVAEEFGVDAPWLKVPVIPMQMLGSICEAVCKPFRINPPIFRRRVDFFTKSRWFTSEKAKRELGFVPAQSLREEISDIANWYMSEGLISTKSRDQNYLLTNELIHPRPSLFIRNINGEIDFWDKSAEKRYGWSPDQAIGSVSHELLNTVFPSQLEDINSELLKKASWSGRLIHTRRDGSKIEVQSRWDLERQNDGNCRVIETNINLNKRNRSGGICGSINALFMQLSTTLLPYEQLLA